MTRIDKNAAPTANELSYFLNQVDFSVPEDFVNFFREANGADITADETPILLWPVTDMVQLNVDYNVTDFAPNFFVFGSNGSDTAFAIEKKTGEIYEIPFIGMSREAAVCKYKTFREFVNSFLPPLG